MFVKLFLAAVHILNHFRFLIFVKSLLPTPNSPYWLTFPTPPSFEAAIMCWPSAFNSYGRVIL